MGKYREHNKMMVLSGETFKRFFTWLGIHPVLATFIIFVPVTSLGLLFMALGMDKVPAMSYVLGLMSSIGLFYIVEEAITSAQRRKKKLGLWMSLFSQNPWIAFNLFTGAWGLFPINLITVISSVKGLRALKKMNLSQIRAQLVEQLAQVINEQAEQAREDLQQLVGQTRKAMEDFEMERRRLAEKKLVWESIGLEHQIGQELEQAEQALDLKLEELTEQSVQPKLALKEAEAAMGKTVRELVEEAQENKEEVLRAKDKKKGKHRRTKKNG